MTADLGFVHVFQPAPHPGHTLTLVVASVAAVFVTTLVLIWKA